MVAGERPGDHFAARMSGAPARLCIYPGCGRPAAPPHPLGGPQPSFCEREDHNALTAYRARRSLEREAIDNANRTRQRTEEVQ
jgi:hypothetical protein